ncbi:MAG TPA: hypothetical protein ENF36_02085 [Desulfobacteraceae bacterium]|nr:hypothetical protein [Desulfobacteraceae bacterium]
MPIARCGGKNKMITCAFCNQEIEFEGRVSRNDTCPNCGCDLHCCLQCKFYDSGSYNECKEVLAERTIDKERANICEYFVLKGSKEEESGRKAAAKKALEDLFGKK